MINTKKQLLSIAKEIKRMPDDKVVKKLQSMCFKYTDSVLDVAMEVLHDEFKFGPQRQDKFINTLNAKLKKEIRDEKIN